MKCLSWIKNSLKSQKIAVGLTQVSSLTVSTRKGKNYNISTNYHISAKITSAMYYWDHFTLTSCVVHGPLTKLNFQIFGALSALHP